MGRVWAFGDGLSGILGAVTLTGAKSGAGASYGLGAFVGASRRAGPSPLMLLLDGLGR